jgi:ABC-2 type transport system permease protein
MNQKLTKGFIFSKHIRDFRWLLQGQLFELRTMWFWYLIQNTFQALFLMVFLVFFVGELGPERLRFIFVGALVVNMGSGMMLSLGQTVGGLKDRNAFEHYAALPISKTIFIAALIMRGVIIAAPSLLIMLMVGGIALDMWITPVALLVLMLGGFTMAVIGAFIGFWSPTGQIASMATQVVLPLFIFLAPVFFPLEHLPGPLQVVARFIPTTYMAEGLRAAMAGRIDGEFWLHILILTGFAVVLMALVPLKLDWRAR